MSRDDIRQLGDQLGIRVRAFERHLHGWNCPGCGGCKE